MDPHKNVESWNIVIRFKKIYISKKFRIVIQYLQNYHVKFFHVISSYNNSSNAQQALEIKCYLTESVWHSTAN